MSSGRASRSTDGRAPAGPALRTKTTVGFALYALGVPAVLFVCAGTVRWPMAWAYFTVSLGATLATRLVLLKKHPDLLRERQQATRAPGTRSWDRLLVPVVALYGPVATMVVAGLDRRFGWSPTITPAVGYVAAAALVGAYAFAAWAMVSNPYFSAVARIQSDRDQVVVTAGPYRLVRHPAYAGALAATLLTPVLLGTVAALLPAVLVAVALVLRTALEDRMLHSGLAGYREYCGRTPHRLVPGLW